MIITEFFKAACAESVDIKDEMYKDKEDQFKDLDLKIKTGNLIVKCKVKRDNEKFNIVSGVNIFKSGTFSYKALISKFGEAAKCLLRGEEGHIRRDCYLRNTKCDKCAKYGHSTDKCSYSSRFFNNKNEENPDEFDEDMDIQTIEMKPFTLTTRIMKYSNSVNNICNENVQVRSGTRSNLSQTNKSKQSSHHSHSIHLSNQAKTSRSTTKTETGKRKTLDQVNKEPTEKDKKTKTESPAIDQEKQKKHDESRSGMFDEVDL